MPPDECNDDLNDLKTFVSEKFKTGPLLTNHRVLYTVNNHQNPYFSYIWKKTFIVSLKIVC